MARVKIGDVVEIRTSKGLAYALYTHKHKMYGALLRVFGRIYEVAPNDVTATIEGAPSFSTFFPLGAAVNRNIVSISGNVAVPSKLQPFPLFRNGVVDPITGKVGTWWLWDGEKEWRVGTLASEQRKLPILGVWNDTMLVKRIETGWTPETDPES